MLVTRSYGGAAAGRVRGGCVARRACSVWLRLGIAFLVMALPVVAADAMTLTERSDAVLGTAAALRAAGRQDGVLAEAIREVVAARRARDGERLRNALERAEQLLERSEGREEPPIALDLRGDRPRSSWQVRVDFWREGREAVLLRPHGEDERALYLRFRTETSLRLVVHELPRETAVEMVRPGPVPPHGYARWNAARLRVERVLALAGHRVPGLAVVPEMRRDSVAWRIALERDGVPYVSEVVRRVVLGGEGETGGERREVAWALTAAGGELEGPGPFLARLGDGGESRLRIVLGGASASWRHVEAAMKARAWTIVAWPSRGVAAWVGHDAVLIANGSERPVQVDIFPPPLGGAGSDERGEESVGAGSGERAAAWTGMAEGDRAVLRVWTASGQLEQSGAVSMAARHAVRLPPGGIGLIEPGGGR